MSRLLRTNPVSPVSTPISPDRRQAPATERRSAHPGRTPTPAVFLGRLPADPTDLPDDGVCRVWHISGNLKCNFGGTTYVIAPGGGGGGGTLDDAYDFGGAGAGRTVNATDGAVLITNPDADAGVPNLELARAAAYVTEPHLGIRATGDAQYRFTIDGNGRMQWGSGAGAADVILARAAANHIGLAAGDYFRVQIIADTAGNPRILTAAASPHVSIYDDLKIVGNMAIDNANPSASFWVNVPASVVPGTPAFTGINLTTSVYLDTGAPVAAAYALRGVYRMYRSRAANTANNQVIGLDFIALAGLTTAFVHTYSNLIGIKTGLYAGSTTALGTLNITNAAGVQIGTVQNLGPAGIPNITALYGVHILDQGASFVTTAWGLAIEDVSNAGTNYVLEAGGTIGVEPYQRIIGSWAPAINTAVTPIYIDASNNDNPITTTLRHLQWLDPGAGGVNFAGGERVCILV